MNIYIENISLNFNEKKIFDNFSLVLTGENYLPAVILGPSGCGKTTLLKLLAGLLKPAAGKIYCGTGTAVSDPAAHNENTGNTGAPCDHIRDVSFVFQEPRFLPWYTVLENVMLPIEKKYGKNKSRETAMHYLELVSLEKEARSYPEKLSGGQRQRASIARAFAYPSQLLLMDEPFQSMDIPLRIELMELCLSLLEREKRLTLAVTHDPREAVFMGSRIIVMGQNPRGIIYDEKISLEKTDRGYGAAAAGELEELLIEKLSSVNSC